MNIIPKNKKGKIFVLWFQGEEKAPLLVRMCIESIRKNSNGHEVIILSDNNLNKWISPFPEAVEKKFRSKIFSLQLKSDLIRFSILSKYNGLWLDATVFVSKPIPDYVFEKDFFTVVRKEASKKDITGKISPLLIGRNNSKNAKQVFEFSRKILMSYILRENELINYLLIENILYISIQRNKWLAHLMDEYFDRKKDILGLVNKLNNSYDERTLKKFLDSNIFNKFNYHKIYKFKVNDNTTVYGHLVKDLL